MAGLGTTPSLLINTDSPSNLTSRNPASFAAYLNRVTGLLWLTVPPVLFVMGCYGNVMTIVVMRAMRASESTACLSVYFTALAVSDLCLLTSFMSVDWLQLALHIPVMHFHDVICAGSLFMIVVTPMISAWLLMAMTGQRMLSVILPHRVGVLCTARTAKIITAVLVAAACVSSVQILFNYRVDFVNSKDKRCHNIDKYIGKIFFVLVLVFSSAIPFLFLVVANCVLIRGVIQSVKMSRVMTGSDVNQTTSRSAQVSSMTTTLILTSIAFLVLTIPMCVAHIYLEEVGFFVGRIQDEDMRATLALFDAIALMMWMSNSAVNFYIYILSGRKFRQEAKRYLCLAFQNQKTP